MNQDLGFSPEVYGFASGVFFFGYFLFEVPSNLMLQKVGAQAVDVPHLRQLGICSPC